MPVVDRTDDGARRERRLERVARDKPAEAGREHGVALPLDGARHDLLVGERYAVARLDAVDVDRAGDRVRAAELLEDLGERPLVDVLLASD